MKAKEYLHQAYRLDKRIQSNIEEMERLRELSTSVSSPSWGERIQKGRHTDALFVRYLERIEELQIKINDEDEEDEVLNPEQQEALYEEEQKTKAQRAKRNADKE